MVLKPTLDDLKIIGYSLGKMIIGLGLTMIFPLLCALLYHEINPCYDFSIGLLLCLIFGQALTMLCYTKRDLGWTHGMVVVALSWLVSSAFAAVPFYLSGHWKSFLDCIFDAMSGFTTSGIFLAQDIDHLSHSVNFWRHFTMFIGGQGIVVIALTFLVQGSSGAFRMYAGEGRDEKLLPNVLETSRFILFINIVYLVIATAILSVIAVCQGIAMPGALFHGVCMFMAAFSTGGFAPQSQNAAYYHSLPFEVAIIVIMIAGSLNFNLHYTLWLKRKKEIIINIETKTFFMTATLIFFLVAIGLAKSGVYENALGLFRKGFYQLISAHTTTGFQTIYSRQFIHEWGAVALVALILAMAFGASACSTGGGIKCLRIGIIFKALYNDVKRIMLPESAVFIEKYHHLKDAVLDDRQVRSAVLIFLCYIGLYAAGGIIGMLLGYPALAALFESVSAGSNTGLSCGITQAAMPVILKITYILQMWIGRLEFMSVFVLIGFFAAFVRGK